MELEAKRHIIWPLLAIFSLSSCDEATLSALSQGLSQMGQMNGAQLPTPIASGGQANAQYFPPVTVSGAASGTYYANYYARSCAGQSVVYPAANACQDALGKIRGANIVAQPRPAVPTAPTRTMIPVPGHNANLSAVPPTATIMAKPSAGSSSTTSAPSGVTTGSYRDHPELEASRCLSFHGPIDLYGERVTNSCGYPVAFTFCIDGANSALSCKASGEDIGSGTDTIGAGKTQDTGYVGSEGHSIQTHWHACRGKLGDVLPMMRSRSLGACMRY